jgi:myo-inositol-1-phosphate synthase
MARPKSGIWLIGARGGVAVTTMVGLSALRKGLIGSTGLVSELPFFAPLNLLAWDEVSVGGHDIRNVPLWDVAEKLCHHERLFSVDVLAACKRELHKFEKNIKTGTIRRVGPAIEALADRAIVKRRPETPRAVVDRLAADMRDFVKRNKLSQLVVVNLASTEPPVDDKALARRWVEMEKRLEHPRKCVLPASALYAIAALDNGFPYINFTPSLGSTPRAIQELAQIRETCHVGTDGKTGETLLKTVLAPMFSARNLEVMSWVGHNIFGNMDGQILDDPKNKQTKVTSKDNTLKHVLGYQPQSLVTIEYIRSLGDWKTAWDHIHFKGFLGTPMKLQFTWQGSDSLLAAPLVIDLVRFVHAADVRGETGVLKFLASFFKSPMGVREHEFARQFQMLIDWAKQAEGQELKVTA